MQAIKEGIKSCSVELSFEDKGKHYHAQRIFPGNGQKSFKVHEIRNYSFSDVPNREAFINSILPKDIAEYFFFHGEGVSNINAQQSGEKFKRAIRDILGFRLAETAVNDLRKLKGA